MLNMLSSWMTHENQRPIAVLSESVSASESVFLIYRLPTSIASCDPDADSECPWQSFILETGLWDNHVDSSSIGAYNILQKNIRRKIMVKRLFCSIMSVLLLHVFAAGVEVFAQGNPSSAYLSAAEPGQAAGKIEPVRALRAVIEYNEGTFRLEKLIPLRMILQPSDPDPRDAPGGSASGFWIELCSADGTVLYRKILDDPILYHQEGVDPDNPEGTMQRVDHVPLTRTFSILIPDLSNGDRVVFFSSVIPNLAQPSTASQADIDYAKLQPAQAIGSVQISQARSLEASPASPEKGDVK